MTTAENSTKLRALHDLWWRAVIEKRWATAEFLANELRQVAQLIYETTKKESEK